MKLIPIEDLERWPVKVIAFFYFYTSGNFLPEAPTIFYLNKMSPYCAFGMGFVGFN